MNLTEIEGMIKKHIGADCFCQDHEPWYTDSGLAKSIEQYVLKARKALVEYCVHDKECLCSQNRAGKPTDDGDYLNLYGYGLQEKWYSRNKKEEPKCSCGLTAELEKGLK